MLQVGSWKTSRWTVIAAGIGALVLAVSYQHARPPARQSLAATRPASGSGPAATTSVTPSYLPPGATLVQGANQPLRPQMRLNQYQLAGLANSNTIPSTGVDETNMFTVHPETLLSVSFVPNIARMPELLPADEDLAVTEVDVAGLPALLTSPRRGFGTFRLDWLDAAGYHTVMCDRLDTEDGVSGLDADELIRVATSLYN